jgi:carbon monoxide dehydrogenase subunit G
VRIEVGITVAAPPAAVWRVVEPVERHVEWMADAESIRFTTDQTRGVGTAFDCTTRVGPLRTTDRMEIVEWDAPLVMGIVHRGVVTGRGQFTLRPSGTGTRFTWSEQLTFPLWMGGAVGAFLAKPVLRAIWRRNLRRLKELVETNALEAG